MFAPKDPSSDGLKKFRFWPRLLLPKCCRCTKPPAQNAVIIFILFNTNQPSLAFYSPPRAKHSFHLMISYSFIHPSIHKSVFITIFIENAEEMFIFFQRRSLSHTLLQAMIAPDTTGAAASEEAPESAAIPGMTTIPSLDVPLLCKVRDNKSYISPSINTRLFSPCKLNFAESKFNSRCFNGKCSAKKSIHSCYKLYVLCEVG